MPRCKSQECRTKFTAKYFLQKYCSKECKAEADEPVKNLNKKADKRKDEEEIYAVVRKAYLIKEPYCEKCSSFANQIHHKNGRNGKRLIDVDYFMAVCSDCHSWIHEHPKESRLKGWLI